MGEDKYPPAPDWMPKELLANEKESLGFYISGHPLDRYGGEIGRFTDRDVRQLHGEGRARGRSSSPASSTGLTERPMKSGMGKIAYFSLEDQTGQIEFFVKSPQAGRVPRPVGPATSRCW